VQLGDTPAPFDLTVVEVTDQGKRRPTKVARLTPVGERKAIAELVAPKLVWLDGWGLVLSGIEGMPSAQGRRDVYQSWICKLSPPAFTVGYKVTSTYDGGVLRPRRALREAGHTGGHLTVTSRIVDALGRHAICAELMRYAPSGTGYRPSQLVDCRLEWMGEDRFELVGLAVRPAHEDRPEEIECGGWICGFDVEVPSTGEPTRSERKPLR
jgi:hypothetical protein